MTEITTMRGREQFVSIETAGVELGGNLTIPDEALGLVLFAHGSGSSRHSPRNRQVARLLNDRRLATLLVDLLTTEEEQIDVRTREYRFDIPLLADRLAGAAEWLGRSDDMRDLQIGCFGASTGAGAALIAAARRPEDIHAVVSRGGRPDLADEFLPQVQAPTLLIVGGNDTTVIGLNREALARMTGAEAKELTIVPGATHLFEEPGALEEVARLAGDWFIRHLHESSA